MFSGTNSDRNKPFFSANNDPLHPYISSLYCLYEFSAIHRIVCNHRWEDLWDISLNLESLSIVLPNPTAQHAWKITQRAASPQDICAMGGRPNFQPQVLLNPSIMSTRSAIEESISATHCPILWPQDLMLWNKP